MANPSKLRVPAHANQLALIADFIAKSARQAGLDERRVYHVQSAVDEACANVIYHAYDYEGQGSIELSCEKRHDDFCVTITDHGRPFDPTSIETPDVNARLEERKEGGLGYFLMTRLMDEVRYQFTRGANVLTMIKHIR